MWPKWPGGSRTGSRSGGSAPVGGGAGRESHGPDYRGLGRRTEGEEPRARVLVADDDGDMRRYLSRLLSRAYEVEEVADGRGRAGGGPRAAAGPGPGRRDDAETGRVRAAARVARRPPDRGRARGVALRAGGGGVSPGGAGREGRRLSGQAVQRPRNAGPGRHPPRNGPHSAAKAASRESELCGPRPGGRRSTPP